MKVRYKQEDVFAVQVPVKADDTFLDTLKAEGFDIDEDVEQFVNHTIVYLPEGDQAESGEYIIKDETGQYWGCSKHDFLALFDIVDNVVPLPVTNAAVINTASSNTTSSEK